MPTIALESRTALDIIDSNPSGTPAVLLLHGLGATGESWRPQITYLSEAGFRVVAPDARGFGSSPYPGGGNSVAIVADDCAALLGALGIDRAHVAGISMGGAVALQLALSHPELVDRLVLMSTFARLRPKSPGVWLYFALRLLLVHTLGLPAQAQKVAKRIFPHDDQEAMRQDLVAQVCQADPRGYRAMMRGLLRFDAADRLGEIRSPTLVVTGTADTTVPPATQQVLADRIAGSRHVVIRDGGHALITDRHDEISRLLVEFLRGDAPASMPA